MAKKNLQAEIETLINNGTATLIADGKFVDNDGNKLGVRSMDNINDPLEVGDVITVPADFKVLSTKVGDRTACFTMVNVTNADGEERAMRLFPNSLAKVAFPLDGDGKRMPKVKTGGAVAKWYQEQAGADEAIKALSEGKAIKVTGKTTYKVHNRFSNQDENTNIFTYEWA